MNLLVFLDRRARLLAATATVVGLLSGAASAALIALVNTALVRGRALPVSSPPPSRDSSSRRWSPTPWPASACPPRATHELPVHDLSRKVLATPLRQLEAIGIARILSTLTDDVVDIGRTIDNVPAVAMNVAVLGGCAVYLGWLSWRILLVVPASCARRDCLPRA